MAAAAASHNYGRVASDSWHFSSEIVLCVKKRTVYENEFRVSGLIFSKTSHRIIIASSRLFFEFCALFSPQLGDTARPCFLHPGGVDQMRFSRGKNARPFQSMIASLTVCYMDVYAKSGPCHVRQRVDPSSVLPLLALTPME